MKIFSLDKNLIPLFFSFFSFSVEKYIYTPCLFVCTSAFFFFCWILCIHPILYMAGYTYMTYKYVCNVLAYIESSPAS